MTQTTEAHCDYTLHANGIHDLILRKSGMQSADAYFEQLEMLMRTEQPSNQPLLVILNTNYETLPLSYAMQRGKALNDIYGASIELCVAVLTDSIGDAHIADILLRLARFGGSQVRFFEMSHRDKAISWLLSQQ